MFVVDLDGGRITFLAGQTFVLSSNEGGVLITKREKQVTFAVWGSGKLRIQEF